MMAGKENVYARLLWETDGQDAEQSLASAAEIS